MQRKCLLLTLQVRMLLREMTEHQIERQLAIARDPEFHRLMVSVLTPRQCVAESKIYSLRA